MKKFILCTLVGISFVYLTGCGNESQKQTSTTDTVLTNTPTTTPALTTDTVHNSANSLDWDGMYKGILPCADCEGIETVLTLNQDKTYSLKTAYLGKSDKVVEETGNFSWNSAGNTITLSSSADKPNQYFVGENMLLQLDMNGNKISGEDADKYKLTKQSIGSKATTADIVKPKSDASLVETYWKLTELGGKPWQSKKGVREIHIILKQKDSRVQGFLGCNTCSGSYELKEGNRISFKNVAITLMACPDMTMEDELKKVLERTDNYSISGDKLSLNKARMAPLARFEAVYLR